MLNSIRRLCHLPTASIRTYVLAVMLIAALPISLLMSGQVWVQSESVTQVALKVGDVVTIRKASLGSHMLVAPNRAAMRVRRIR